MRASNFYNRTALGPWFSNSAVLSRHFLKSYDGCNVEEQVPSYNSLHLSNRTAGSGKPHPKQVTGNGQKAIQFMCVCVCVCLKIFLSPELLNSAWTLLISQVMLASQENCWKLSKVNRCLVMCVLSLTSGIKAVGRWRSKPWTVACCE